jgi:hypothetical protein
MVLILALSILWWGKHLPRARLNAGTGHRDIKRGDVSRFGDRYIAEYHAIYEYLYCSCSSLDNGSR